MSFCDVLAALPADYLVPLDGDAKLPKDGDLAYSRYHGTEYIGVLDKMSASWVPPEQTISPARFTGSLIPAPGKTWNFNSADRLYVGYDLRIEWDDDRNMWYAPADFD